jgi:hypothetical protein
LGERREFYAHARRDQAKRVTKAQTQWRTAAFFESSGEKKICLSIRQQEMHYSSTAFPQLDLFQTAHYP